MSRRIKRPIMHVHMEFDFRIKNNTQMQKLIDFLESLKQRKAEHE